MLERGQLLHILFHSRLGRHERVRAPHRRRIELLRAGLLLRRRRQAILLLQRRLPETRLLLRRRWRLRRLVAAETLRRGTLDAPVGLIDAQRRVVHQIIACRIQIRIVELIVRTVVI